MSEDERVDELRGSLAGSVIGPADPGYDEARRCFNLLVDRRPALIARCAGPDDVAVAFDFARTTGLEVAVRGGGHNPAGHCVCDDGLVIDLTALRSVEVDRDAGVARSGGGATWLDFDTATQAAGLVTPGGVVGSTGVCGLALGGGIGHLTAQHGLTCDNIVGAEVVSPDGTVTAAGPDGDEELLWALRGGGGNFGVATRVDFRLYPLEQVVGGVLRYRGDRIGETLRVFREVVANAPRELSCQAVIETDETLTPGLRVVPCYTGGGSEPEALALLRSAPGLVDDGLRSHTFLDQQRVFGSTYAEDRNYWKGHFVRELSDELIDELLRRIVALGREPGSILIESLHGGPKDPDVPAGALGFRGAAFNVSAMAAWLDPGLDAEHIAWARETAAAVEPWSTSGGYANYMQADEPIERVRAAFGPEAFDRLQALKTRLDPDNVLHRNQNIPPGGP
jgi:FAD/FMN-containing dehydrogenase